MAYFLLVGLMILLTACNSLLNPDSAQQPPLPTIVPVTSTSTPELSPTTPPILTATIVASQAEPIPTIESTIEPTPTSTTVAPPTEVPPTPTFTPVPTDTPVVIERPSLDSIGLQLISVASGFTRPVYLTHANDGTGRLFVVEQAGRILILKKGAINPIPFLDIVSIVGSDANEQGLLSVAFHPNYPNNGYFFVNYTNRQGDTVIARYNASDNPDIADPNSEMILMTIGQPHANHNGGQIAFGPDGYLYIGMGDGGAANDPENRAQSLSTLLGKILRIDVDNGDPYGVPETNPFVGNEQARPEIWSYGWRNPWRFSFDVDTGDFYAADVGQNQFEEVHVELAGTEAGQNYGWRLMEGLHCFRPAECDPTSLGLALPVAEYDHDLGCSITGGYVYRGTQFPALGGIYLYGDYCSGIIWGIRYEVDGTWSKAQFLQSSESISSFGQDEFGEVYLVDHKGEIFLVGN